MKAYLRTSFLHSAVVAFALASVVSPTYAGAGDYRGQPRVLLISVDGLHEADVAVCVRTGDCRNIAELLEHGIHYTNAQAPKPTDSFPGLFAQFSGALPKTTGVYYDDSYDRTLWAPGCTGNQGSEVNLAENLDFDSTLIDGGKNGSLNSLNAGIAINPANLPGQKSGAKCNPLYPHDFGRTNTIIGVLRNHRFTTAWADKHPAYDLVNGPGLPHDGPSSGLNDFFAPEINSSVNPTNISKVATAGLKSTYPAPTYTGGDFTGSSDAVKYYDGIKVNAVLNWIKGNDHNGKAGLNPNFFGMNFQAVSVSQKLADCKYSKPALAVPASPGGYADGAANPLTCLKDSIKWVDQQIGTFIAALGPDGCQQTLIIISAKHGQSPIDRTLRYTYDDGVVIKAPIGSNYAFDIADDGALIWLKNSSDKATADAVGALQNYSTANAVQGHNGTGIGQFLYGAPLANVFGDPKTDPRTPDIITIAVTGTIYTTGSKLAEHGGF